MDVSHSIGKALLDDHEKLEILITRLLDAVAADDRSLMCGLFEEFDAHLAAHFSAEERSLLPALFRSAPTAARTIAHEHRHLRARLMELGTQIELHILRLDTVQSFIDELRAHARHESKLLYQFADESLPDDERREALAAFDASVSAGTSSDPIEMPSGPPQARVG